MHGQQNIKIFKMCFGSQTVLAYPKVLNVDAVEETFREFCVSVQKKKNYSSV